MTEETSLKADIDDRFAKLVGEADGLRPELHRYASRLVGSVIDGEDVLQDALASALAAVVAIPSDTPLRPWLFRIVHNRGIDFMRQRKTRRSEPLEANFETEDASAIDAEDLLIRQETVTMALGHFMALPLPQRSTVILKDVLGESLADIAVLLDLTVDAVKAHLWRGRAALRSLSKTPPEVPRRPSPELVNFAALFNARDWDALRRLLADDVRLRQARRPPVSGAAQVGQFFSYYAAYPPVRVEPAWMEGQEVLLVTDALEEAPTYFMVLEWHGQSISLIRDHRYATYVMDGAEPFLFK